MSLSHYSCDNCGFWQQYFAAPPFCPVCSDVRNALPENGWNFVSVDEFKRRETFGEVQCSWRFVEDDIVMFTNSPQIGIGSNGYLILRDSGNISFEAAGFYTQNALDKIKELGGISILSSSHPHGFGALWQLESEFQPETVLFQREAVQFTKAITVNQIFDDELKIDDEISLHYVGGHYEGHSVLYYSTRKTLFCGDALKFETENGITTGVSCHKAFHKQIPLSPREIEKYREVLSKLDFTQTFTPFEHNADSTNEDAMRLFEAQLQAKKTFTTPLTITRNL
ncbi:MAG: hypothetical protein H7Z37_16745 [Pyrinomonadaceae bacterium]|nr:hypothetical protein [Pyrinomonadaceae bacterium]